MRFIHCILLFAATATHAQQPPDGRLSFENHCAACHGADGGGGERGPSILPRDRARARTRDELREIIRNGIPAAGMPPANASGAELDALIAYVRSLVAPAMENPAPGDAAAGQAFFFGSGGCAKCHMIGGRGAISGPDLSELARERTVADIERALRDPSRDIARGFHAATVRPRGGGALRGFIKNESNYDLQLQSLDGGLHLLRRADVASITRDKASLMPPVGPNATGYRDLLAYLTRLDGGDAPPAALAPLPGHVAWERLANPRPGDWPTYHGRISGNRHSQLAEINTTNVARLAPLWIFTIPGPQRLQVTPVVVDGVMYVTAPNEAYALDAATGRQVWRSSRPRSKGLSGDAASGINRGAAIAGDRVFIVTDNAHLIALHRVTGRLLWDVEMADYRQNYGATMAPLVVRDLVICGTSGGDEGARGFLSAYKVTTGERVWRFWTVPAPGEPLAETWKGSAIEHGCATTWLTGTYDPEADLLYWPTGNPCPDYNGDERQGDNLYSDSILALKPDTGELKWYYQYTPHDVHDWDAQQPPLLLDAEFRGRPRKLLVQANRNGFFYVLDRLTGELLLAKPFVQKLTWASGIGPDGRPQRIPGTSPTPQGTKACPAVEGATNWMSTAYNPDTRLFYVMALEKCVIFTKSPDVWKSGESFFGGSTREVPGEPGQKFLRAIDVNTGKIVWEYAQTGPANSWGGALSTAGGLVFFGDDGGAFAAVDARTGKPLWHFNASVFWKASPMTYAAGGRQFVAVAAGPSILAFGLPENR